MHIMNFTIFEKKKHDLLMPNSTAISESNNISVPGFLNVSIMYNFLFFILSHVRQQSLYMTSAKRSHLAPFVVPIP